MTKSFADYKDEGAKWITLANGEYYPDILPSACDLYEPIIVLFGELVKISESSESLLRQIMKQSDGWTRVQLLRVFRKYVSPTTPVEMLKRKNKIEEAIRDFSHEFRSIAEVHEKYNTRPKRDEALCAVLWEYKDRGSKGYDLTERFFQMVRGRFPTLKIIGPERAGKDILMGEIFSDYPSPTRPVDFAIFDEDETLLIIGDAHYDSDRGGGQEDDRTGQYQTTVDEIIAYSDKNGLNLKVVFLNDGPGLLLGSMWNDYSALEKRHPGRVMVVTLRMIPERLSLEWIKK